MSFEGKVALGMVWSSLQKVGSLLVNFLVSVLLARLLEPEHFGVIAIALAIVTLAEMLVNCGFDKALVQKQELQLIEISSVFWFNHLAGSLLIIVVVSFAAILETTFQLAELKTVLYFLSLKIFFEAVGAVPRALLERNLEYKVLFKINFIGITVSGLTGIAAGYWGMGIGSLILYQLVQKLLLTSGYWFFSAWKPDILFSRQKLSLLWGFASNMLYSNFLKTASDSLYRITIGKFFSGSLLGFYYQGKKLKDLTAGFLNDGVSEVTFSFFSRIHASQNLGESIRSILNLLLFVTIPVFSVLIYFAPQIIGSLLGNQWLPMVPYFQILSVSGLFYPFHVINLKAISAKGLSGLFLTFEATKTCLRVLNLVVGAHMGLITLVCGEALMSFISFWINTSYSRKYLGIGSIAQLKIALPYFIHTAIFLAATIAFDHWFATNTFFWMLLKILAAGTIYLILNVSFKSDAIRLLRIQIPKLVNSKINV